VLVSRGRTADDSAHIPPRVNTALLRAPAKQHIYHFCWYLSLDQSALARIQIRQPTLVHESLLSSREPRQELTSQVDVAPLGDGVARQPWRHPLELRLAYPQEVCGLLGVHDLPAAGERLGGALDLIEDRGLQECVEAGVLVDPHGFQSSLSGPACWISSVIFGAGCGDPRRAAFRGFERSNRGGYSRHVPIRLG
jgi:hypothetical protein